MPVLAGTLVALLVGDGSAHAAALPSCPVGITVTPCADLVAGRLTAKVIDGGRRLELTGSATNAGTADAPQTTLQVTIGPDSLPEEPLQALQVKETVPLTLDEAIPVDLRGTGQPITVTLDPEDTVTESDKTNNTSPKTKAFFPTLPDLALSQPVLRVESGNSIVVEVTVVNQGSADDTIAPTLTATAAGIPHRRTVQPLAQGASRSVKLRLLIPPKDRVGPVSVTLAIDNEDVVAEQDEDNNTLTPRRVTIAPDLVLVSVMPRVRGRSVTLDVTVRNDGNATAPETNVEATSPGWQPATRPIDAVPVGDPHTTLTLIAPRSAQGHDAKITVTVDPVPGDPRGNNTSVVPVHIRSQPLPPPDVALSGFRARIHRSDVILSGTVANIGVAPARVIRLALRAKGWPPRTRTLHDLAPGRRRPVAFVLGVPPGAAGTSPIFRVRAEPVARERNLANNRTATTFLVPLSREPVSPEPHRWWPYALAALGGLLALSIGVVLTLRGRRLRMHLRWQKEAETERPETCEAPEWHVLQGKGEPKPAFRSIEQLRLSAHDADGAEEQTLVDAAIVDTLNRALWAHRIRRRRRVRKLVEPLGERLAAEIERWLAERSDTDVAVRAEIKGGKLECEFTRSECVRDGDTCHWEERQTWKHEFEHKVEELVTAVHIPLEPRPDRVQQLSADLVALIGRVDVPRRLRAPDATPLPRD